MIELTIAHNDAGQRLDRFLQKAFPDLPVALCYKYIRLKRIKVNGSRAQIGQKLALGDRLLLYVADEFLGTATDRPLFYAAPSALDILFEDENILLLNKPEGLLCHEDSTQRRDTLINRVLRYLADSGQYNPCMENSFAPALCNRIDRNTQGIVIAAKNAEALREMDRILRERLVEKRYLCIALGRMPESHAILRGWHTKDEINNRAHITPGKRPGAKDAVTEYTVCRERDGLSLLEVVLHTGRTHQIRAHLALVGHPLLGDRKYGASRQNAGFGRTHQALCAWALRFGALPAGSPLAYLSGKEFRLPEAGFVEEYFKEAESNGKI